MGKMKELWMEQHEREFTHIEEQEIFNTIVEEIAEKVHQSWVKIKQQHGYVWGEVVNNDLVAGPLTHPDLVPYHMLSEGIKDYDRVTTITVLNALRAAGYDIIKHS
jgi:hypothetical protein